jgi:hypothetical protein
MESISKFPKFLIDNGLIFEINRKVLHPLGMALVVDIDRNSKRQLAITALLETEDQEGFIFDEETYNVGNEKYQKFLKNGGQKRLTDRFHKYGFIDQHPKTIESDTDDYTFIDK